MAPLVDDTRLTGYETGTPPKKDIWLRPLPEPIGSFTLNRETISPPMGKCEMTAPLIVRELACRKLPWPRLATVHDR